MIDYKKNSKVVLRRNNTKNITVEKEYFTINKSKPIIDNIDRALAAHYGFTAEELEFIINYDIKYRMGRGAENGGEED
jgi:hypothetical protein